MSADPIDNQVRVLWPFEMEEPQVVNQFVIQNSAPLQDGEADDTVYLMLGHFSPPVISDAQQGERLLKATGGTLSISLRGSYAMSVSRLRELHGLIGSHLARTDNGQASNSDQA